MPFYSKRYKVDSSAFRLFNSHSFIKYFFWPRSFKREICEFKSKLQLYSFLYYNCTAFYKLLYTVVIVAKTQVLFKRVLYNH